MNTAPQKSFPVTWDQFHRDSRALAWRLMSLAPFDALVAITRGGLVPAAIVARELNIRTVETVAVKTYDHQSKGNIQLLKPIAEEAGLTMAQLAVAWVLQNSNVSAAIIGASRPEQVTDNVKAAGVRLDEATLKAIDEAVGPVVERDPAQTRNPRRRDLGS